MTDNKLTSTAAAPAVGHKPGNWSRRQAIAAMGALATGAPWIARAQSGPIRVALTVAHSGVEKPNGQGLFQGAQACFNAINKAGGIHGRQVELVLADDEFNPGKAKENAVKFAADAGVVALLNPQGTRQTTEVMNAVRKLPIIGPNTGATALHKRGAGNVFWVRTNYDVEVERLVRFADTLNLKKIALVYPNDPFGQSVLDGFNAALARRNIEAVGVASTPGTASLDVEPAAKALAKMPAQVLIMSLVGTLPKFHEAYRAAGGTAISFALSLGGSAPNLAAMAKQPERPIFSVIVPAPNAERFELARRYRADMRGSEFTGESLVSLEGYANARVLAEGMRRAGPKLDRESVTAGLESMNDFDLGGLRIRYGKDAREGNSYTDIITVAQNGQIIS